MVSIESAEPVVSVIIRAPAGSAEYQSLGEELLHRAREAGFSAEVIVVEPRSPPAVDEAIARAVGLARGAFVVFVDPASGFAPQTLSALVAPIAAGTHDLTIAVRDPGRQTKGLAALASGIKSWVSRLIFSPVAETRDPWSGWYALRRDRLVRLGQSGRIFPHDLPAVLIAAGSDLRIVDVRGGTPTTNAGGRAPGLREAWAWLRSGTSGAGIEPAGQMRFGAGAMGIAIDLATTLSLFAFGWTLGASNIAGFVAGALVHRAVRALWSPDPTLSRAARRPSAAQIGRYGVLAALALGLRGGAVATALAYGLPAWLAVIAGLTFGWGAGAAGKSFLAPSPPWPGPTVALRWSLAAVGILGSVFLLHLLYLKVLPLMPEEAYYWNYSVRPDLGYLDHPPMVAWLIALAEALFGHGEASIRVASLACGLAVIAFVYHFARRLVDRPAALLAAALAAVIPYSFFVAGLMITPDAPLAAAWAASLYFFHRALVGGERKAWYGAGIALGLGLLSKYSIATLGPAALAYCILDRRARGWFLRPEPYLAVLIAAVLFAPVVYWNYANEWASFVFQAGGRFDDETQFSLHHMLGNILIVATPLPVMVLPLLFVRRWTEHPGRFPEPAHARGPQSPLRQLFRPCPV